jgi:hypothetical protein
MAAHATSSGTHRAGPLVVRLSSLFLAALFLIPAACAAPGEETGSETRALRTSKISGGCSASRDEILASTSPARRAAIERGFTWLDAQVPYSQSASHEGYRTDCSGFVSMCWELGQSYTTAGFVAGQAESSLLGSYDELLPGDALVHRSGGSGHVVLFLGWDDASQSGACVLEQASTASDMQFRVRTASSLQSGGYKAIRADALANDVGEPETTPIEEDAPVEEPEVCIPESAAVLCAAAAEGRGVQCGLIPDGCGGRISCDKVLGCDEGEVCGVERKNQCGKVVSPADDDAKDDTTTRPQSDVGDVEDDDDDDDKNDKSSKPSTKNKKQISAGCSATPRGERSSGLPALAVVAAAVIVGARRRRTKTA